MVAVALVQWRASLRSSLSVAVHTLYTAESETSCISVKRRALWVFNPNLYILLPSLSFYFFSK